MAHEDQLIGFCGWLQTGELEAYLEKSLSANGLFVTPNWFPQFCLVLEEFRHFYFFNSEEEAEIFLNGQPFQRSLASLARIDPPGGLQEFLKFWSKAEERRDLCDSSYASSADLTSGQSEPSWRRSMAQLHQSNRNSTIVSGQQQQQQQQGAGAKIKNLFRGISIKRTRSIAKLDSRAKNAAASSRENNNSSESQQSNTNNSSLASRGGGGGPDQSGSLQTRGGGGGAIWHDRQASGGLQGQVLSRLAMESDDPSAAMKRSISMGRIGRQPQPRPASRRGGGGDGPGGSSGSGGASGPLSLVASCVPIHGNSGGGGGFDDEESRQRPVTSDPASSGGNSLRSALSHESLLQLSASSATAVSAPLQMSSGTEIRPVHQSLMPGLPSASAAFAVAGGGSSGGVDRYFAAQSTAEAKKWQHGLKKVNRPDLENTRHKENSLKLWIFEAKRLATKKRYFCEICLNHILYARTTSKEKTADTDPFWGEPFEFSNLQDISLVTVKLFREANRKKKKDQNQLIGEIHLPVHEILSQTEQWYSLQPGGQKSSGSAATSAGPSLRVKSRYLSVDVLPLSWYAGLRKFLLANYCQLVRLLEPSLPVRMKEDLACNLVALAHTCGLSESLVADLLLQELKHCGTSEAAAVVAFRGNTIATKSVEYYLKLVGSDYLRSVLAEPVSILLRSDECCEVDPVRVSGPAELDSNQRSLRLFAELFWTRVYTSADRLPVEFGRLFAGIREQSGQQLCNQLVGASIFLRFICPAILGPSLFGLCQELPGPRTARSLTLIAKTVQNLANGTSFGGKEAYMNFMNKFLDQHKSNMTKFVASLQTLQPSTAAAAAAASSIAGNSAADAVDAGFELAQVHNLLTAALDLLQAAPTRNGGVGSGDADLVDSQQCIDELSKQLDIVSVCLKLNVPPSSSSMASPTPPQLQPRSASLAPPTLNSNNSGGGSADSLATRPVRNLRPQAQHATGVASARSTEKVAMATPTSSSASASNSRPVSALAVQEDWRRVLDEAAASAAATVASASAAVAAVSASAVAVSSSADSSGYQSGRLRRQLQPHQPDAFLKQSDSPVQFLNPSYQKSVSALQLPAAAPVGESSDFRIQRRSESNSSGGSSSELIASSSADTGSSSGSSSSEKPQPPPPLPPHKVRMGLKSVQHPHHHQLQQQQQQPSAELLELQRELNETRRQLVAAEAMLRSNEREKRQMLDEFRRGAEERQRREVDNSRQLAEIMERLRLLENDAKAARDS